MTTTPFDPSDLPEVRAELERMLGMIQYILCDDFPPVEVIDPQVWRSAAYRNEGNWD